MGKGGGALSMWIKEFTALVFTQTVQAFIYAMVISIILFGMVKTGSDISADDNNAALGLMSTFALLSVFKVEEMTKRIFGISDTKASHGNAMKSIAKTAIAAKLGSKVLNNAGKVFGGVKSINQAGQDRRKAKKRFDQDMADEGYEFKDGKLVSTAARSSIKGQSQASSTANRIDVNAGASAANGTDDVDIQVGGVAGGNTEMSKAAYRRAKNALRAFEDKADEINKARREGWKNIASGLAESTGAVFGATAGGILGGADGDLDEMLQGMMAGAGAGDIVGKNMVEAVDRAAKFVERNYKREAGMSNKELQRAISGYKEALSKANVNYNSSKIDVGDIEI